MKYSYPAQLQKLLGKSYEVRNFGIGGATLLKGGTPNIWKSLTAVETFCPHIIVVLLGTNDTVSGSRRNWEKIANFTPDYRELIDRLATLETQPQIFLCTPTSMVLNTGGLSEKRLENLKERKPRLQNLCQQVRHLANANSEKNVRLIELNRALRGRPDLLTVGDGVHPNERGYLEIAQFVFQRILRDARRPNIVMFLVDDMGWQDTSVPFHSEVTDFNRRYHTPNMERLAKMGMKFTQAYACSVCSPTRISLMTGLNAAKHRVTNWTLRPNATNDRKHADLEFPSWNVNGLSPVHGVERTIHADPLPSFLQACGYRTIHVGKAHFGAIDTPGSEPKKLGFDVNIAGHAAGGPGSFLGTQNFSAAWRNGDRVWDVPGLEKYHGQDIYLTEALTREANQAIDQAVALDQPFFLYMAHYAVHVPYAVDSRFYAKYKMAGLDHTEAMYAALVEGMDKSLGDIMSNVQRHNLTENTIILFMSDNGGLSAHGRGGKRHTHNKPLSSGKGSAHEGGIRVPMLVAWPGVTKPDSVCHQPVIIEDFFPTILDMAGAPQTEEIARRIDGQSFAPLLHGLREPQREQRPLLWHFPNNWGPQGPGIGPSSAIRIGDWKLIYYHQDQNYELFNLANDIGEQTNLARTEAKIRYRLAGKLREALESVNAQMPTLKVTNKLVPLPGSKITNSSNGLN